MTFGSLFAGIGGFDLGFERAGLTCKWQVESDDYANRVLARHWPNVYRWRDVRTWPQLETERVDVICGGFPCQDISYAGRGAGLDGERSGLFFEAIRVVRELQPRIVVLENVAALLDRGLDRVLGTLAEIGLDAEWCCIPAAGIGSPHVRDRVFMVAYAEGELGRSWFRVFDEHNWKGPISSIDYRKCAKAQRWTMEDASEINGMDDGISSGLDRCRVLGNAVVPQIAEYIGRRIMEIVT